MKFLLVNALLIVATRKVSASHSLRPATDTHGATQTDDSRRELKQEEYLGVLGGEKYELIEVHEVAGRQGIATDGDRYFVSGSKALYTYSLNGTLLNSNEDPFVDLDPEKPANHFGDISVHNGDIYAGIEYFVDGRGQDIQIALYDAETLKFKKALLWQEDSGQVESSGLGVDAANDLVWMTDWVQGNYIYKYRLSDSAYVGKLHLRAVPEWQQGICASGGALYITADDGNADRKEYDNVWKVPAEADFATASAAFAVHELGLDHIKDYGEVEGIDFDEAAGTMLVLTNRGRQITLGMPGDYYPGYTKEISEVNVFRIKEASGDAIASAEDSTSSGGFVAAAGSYVMMVCASIGGAAWMFLN